MTGALLFLINGNKSFLILGPLPRMTGALLFLINGNKSFLILG